MSGERLKKEETQSGSLDYPYPFDMLPTPGSLAWDKVSMYGIVGWFSALDKMYNGRMMIMPVVVDCRQPRHIGSERLVEKAVQFYGQLRVKENGQLTGTISDPLGNAGIEGSLSDENMGIPEDEADFCIPANLQFVKEYYPSSYKSGAAQVPIQYHFIREKDGLWRGGYSFENTNGQKISGTSVCQLNLFHNNAFGIHQHLGFQVT